MSSPAVDSRAGGVNIATLALGAIVLLLLLFLVWQEWSFGRAESAELAEPRPAESVAVNGGGNALSAQMDPGIARVGEGALPMPGNPEPEGFTLRGAVGELIEVIG